MDRFHVVVVGGGVTGGAVAHDLTLRGIQVTLVERGELTSGTSGRQHGLLHSGARYAVSDARAARQCIQENNILRRIMPGSFEENGGMFVATCDAEVEYSQRFLAACAECNIPARLMSAEQACQLEPNLSATTRLAVAVPDATMDGMRMALRFFASAMSGGAVIRTFTEVIGVHSRAGAVTGVHIVDHRSNVEASLSADLVVNATGPWASNVADLAGAHVPVQRSAGVAVALRGRLTNRVISRLGPPGDGDIIVPQRSLSLLGTTAWPVLDPDTLELPAEHVERLYGDGARLVPLVSPTLFHAAWTSVRPLVGSSDDSEGREVSRTFTCIDHRSEGLDGLVTIVGGKATTARAMAEETADLVCRKLGIQAECQTRQVTCLPYTAYYALAA